VRGFLPSFFFPIMARRKENDRPHQSNNEDSDSNSNEDYEEEPDFEDPEDYVDDISEQGNVCVIHMVNVTRSFTILILYLYLDLIGDLIRQRPKETDGVEAIVVVDGVPQVGADRIEKLQNVLRKLFQKFGKITNEFYPLNADGSTKG
jgi:translation initiation factor 3 subunit B